jgi:DNA-directed RNA polymerase beta' subunit
MRDLSEIAVNGALPVRTVAFHLMNDAEVKESGAGFEVVETALEKSKTPCPAGLCSVRLGTDSRALCAVCRLPLENCMGHVGSIPLNTHVFHPWFLRQAIRCLRQICYFCVVRIPASSTTCPTCGGAQPAYTATADEIRCVFTPAQLRSMGDEERKEARAWCVERAARMFRASSFSGARAVQGAVISRLVAPPLLIRPTVRSHGNSAALARDQLSNTLIEVVRAANRTSERARETDIKKCVRLLLESEGGGDRRGAKASSVRVRIAGKAGLFRRHIQGKRLNLSGRGVITPDPCIAMDQIGIPHRMAEALLIEERVFALNQEYIQGLINDGTVRFVKRGGVRMRGSEKFSPRIGDIVFRTLRDGDLVCANRQPTLWKPSFRVFKVKRYPPPKPGTSPVDTIGLPLSSCHGFNADFDGKSLPCSPMFSHHIHTTHTPPPYRR